MGMNPSKRATLADVARAAQVTPATVSNVLSGRVRVAPDTRARVEAAIAALGYEPNLVARGLASRRTMMLALVVPSITNPFYAEVALALERRAAEHDYHLVIATRAMIRPKDDSTYSGSHTAGSTAQSSCPAEWTPSMSIPQLVAAWWWCRASGERSRGNP
jgi:transcriptional regulator with XRE-family HTH domain